MAENVSGTAGHELEAINVQDLKAAMKKGGNISIYNDCICSTAAATAAKVTNTVPPSFSLTAKAKILVKFTYGINVANATLQVGENAAKPIYYQGEALDAGRVKAGMFVLLQYDGTNFNIVGDIAKMDAYYKNLHAGLADNLFGETQTNDVFTFRPTAGIQDIESGDAPVGGGTIKKVEGNAVAWNQIVQNGNFETVSVWTNEYCTYTVANNIATVIPNLIGNYYTLANSYPFNTSHKYYVVCEFNVSVNKTVNFEIRDGVSVRAILYTENITGWQRKSALYQPRAEYYNSYYRIIMYSPSSGDSFQVRNVNIIDLTLLGIDNLTTVAEVEAWLDQNIGLKPYYPYNAGELIPVKEYTVKSVGFNQWDEEWEVGAIAAANGENAPNSTKKRSKNHIKVIPGEKYSFTENDGGLSVFFYRTDKSYIGYTELSGDNTFTVPDNCWYIRFSILGVTYNNDIAIHLSYEGSRNGEYEPYWERKVTLDPTKVYGKLNGSGNSIVVFPDGLKSAGSVKDEIVRLGDVVKAIKRVGVLDLGTISYNKMDNATIFYAFNREEIATTSTNLACPMFVTNKNISTSWTLVTLAMTQVYGIAKISNNNTLCIKINPDDSLASKTEQQFQTAMSGVLLYYELATPEEYILDEDILPIQYRVDNYGTEEVLLGNDEEVVSCSPKMTIGYGINAADTIADLPHSYVSVLPQQLDEEKQKQARRNINAASQDSIIRIQEQLDAINPKVDNDVYVDMGLPSGLLWAKRNIDVTQPDGFAASPFQYECSFFSWGNTQGHNPADASSFSYDWGTGNDGPYASTPGAALNGNASPSFDFARANCGAPWRLPTTEEFAELFNNIDYANPDGSLIDSAQINKLVTIESIVGIYLKSKNNGNFLFFPCSGDGYGTSWHYRGSRGNYWSSSLISATNGRSLHFYAGGVRPQRDNLRFDGFAGRAVM